ncbi:MAG: DUF488 domain-containing protein [Archaeoglobaceae archaeon]|nr:DUF488 domain-containing protein [Archaeoglobaceae archaeon]MDW7989467.1 DUF488 domain-containing protein [Archaeoglobaceae archaeon]
MSEIIFEKKHLVYTIGHSNRDFFSFLNLLIKNGIKILIDVRRFPKSRFEHFNAENLEKIDTYGIEYLKKPKLGGFRKKTVKNSPNIAIKSSGFRNYADYMLTEDFKREIEEVIEVAEKRSTAIMCAEKLYWKCHRKFIADYLLFRGFEVAHIIDHRILIHKLNKNARIEEDKLIYDLEF